MSADRRSKDPPRVEVVDDSDQPADDVAEETPFEAEQRRGRERMIEMWRAAVRSVTEAAQRAAAHNDGATSSAEPAEDDADDADVPTWVFPTAQAPGGSRN